MNSLILLSILLSAALGIARGADLAFGTDAVTGLCTVGSVWWRYAALGAVVLAYRTVPRRRSAGPRDVWQVLAEVAPEYAEWAGFFGFSALKRQAVQAGAVALVGVREADDLLRDVRLFHDQVASRLRRAALVELVETPSPRIAREITSDVDAAHAQQAPRGAESVVISRPEPAAPPSVIPADAGISTTAELAPAGRTAS